MSEPDESDPLVYEGPCWCGVKNPYFSDELEETCGGTGQLCCFCGGDQCVCHWHGGIDCDGCEDCREEDGWFDGLDGDDDER